MSPTLMSSKETAKAPSVNLKTHDQTLHRAHEVVEIEIEALNRLKARLGQDFCTAIELIEASSGRLIVTGMGKSGLIGKKIAATLSSTGTPAYFLHPAEGTHGDLGVLMQQDVVLAISNSGETPELLNILPVIKRFGLPLIAMTGKTTSTLALAADAVLDISVEREACSLGLAPTASTTATLVMGDALAMVLLSRKGFSEEDFAVFHPAGALGKRLLLTVDELLHTGDALPLIPLETPFLEALLRISEKKLGIGLIIHPDGTLAGVLTDGDVRRALTRFADQVTRIQLSEIMSVHPKTTEPGALAVSALRLMETHQITTLLTLSDEGKPTGVLHLHDILKTGIQ